MNINDVLNGSIDVGDNVNVMLQAILDGQKAVIDKITEIEQKQTLLESNIASSNDRHIGETTYVALDGHSKVTIEHFKSSAISMHGKAKPYDETIGDNDDVIGNDDEEYAFPRTDDSNKALKSFRRASVDTTNKSLEPFNVDSFSISTSSSFRDYQFRQTDKEIHMVSNPKCFEVYEFRA